MLWVKRCNIVLRLSIDDMHSHCVSNLILFCSRVSTTLTRIPSYLQDLQSWRMPEKNSPISFNKFCSCSLLVCPIDSKLFFPLILLCGLRWMCLFGFVWIVESFPFWFSFSLAVCVDFLTFCDGFPHMLVLTNCIFCVIHVSNCTFTEYWIVVSCALFMLCFVDIYEMYLCYVGKICDSRCVCPFHPVGNKCVLVCMH